ncbi:hypothetical protein D3C78_1586100 [compost metagenome]
MGLYAVFTHADVVDQAQCKDHAENPEAGFEQARTAELAGVHEQGAVEGPGQEHTTARINAQALVVVTE